MAFDANVVELRKWFIDTYSSPHFSPKFSFLREAQALLSDAKGFVKNRRI
jgi:hypothetical protein